MEGNHFVYSRSALANYRQEGTNTPREAAIRNDGAGYHADLASGIFRPSWSQNWSSSEDLEASDSECHLWRSKSKVRIGHYGVCYRMISRALRNWMLGRWSHQRPKDSYLGPPDESGNLANSRVALKTLAVRTTWEWVAGIEQACGATWFLGLLAKFAQKFRLTTCPKNWSALHWWISS